MDFEKTQQGELQPSVLLKFKQIDDASLKLHVFCPDDYHNNDCWPVVVLFFGGGWRFGEPASWYPQCQRLAEQGYVAIAPEYRVQSIYGTDPRACIADAQSAISWVREQAVTLRCDPRRIYAGGASAGGHVAACCGLLPTTSADYSSRPDAVILFNPLLDNSPGT